MGTASLIKTLRYVRECRYCCDRVECDLERYDLLEDEAVKS